MLKRLWRWLINNPLHVSPIDVAIRMERERRQSVLDEKRARMARLKAKRSRRS